MKFNSNKGSPDIPFELQRAQQHDNLVIFCGAGISKPTLPLFKGLVENVYGRVDESRNMMEQDEFKKEQFDRVLYLLEQRLQGNQVRQAVMDDLQLKPNSTKTYEAIKTHGAILELSQGHLTKFLILFNL